jgi:hypothetical protein
VSPQDTKAPVKLTRISKVRPHGHWCVLYATGYIAFGRRQL